MADQEPVNSGENWERKILEKVALAAIQEQKRARHWGIFFKLLLFVYLFALLFVGMGWWVKKDGLPGKHTALVEVRGVIGPEGMASADNVTTGLQEAFKDKRTQGVIVRINSPGGSPVQAGHINDEIRRLRAKYPNIPVYAVVEDICASGGYYVAVAADRIYVNKSSIIGSIGVLMDGFGFTGAMEKLGIERRLLAAGENKGFLDPFSPIQESQKEYAERMLNEIHQQFIGVVRQGRGKRLKETPEMFSGLLWIGPKSIELGLADALGGVDYVAREVIKAEDIVDFTPRENIAERVARRFGAAMAETLVRLGAVSSLTMR
ncbi:MAG: peptidase S49 [Betaproteobacteria bacterium RIFCSPLOWO2_12_FULL_62_58]|nr:MAG: peptidase S49 [Betaproteobacteria bacterium RIFCSPLOWO2_02_FULL_62_79]OGA51823.1 MAG: peptidase S49 [Betaproteobacteria bacterium RIFCSPLOWO2_12_FULL_62_58]